MPQINFQRVHHDGFVVGAIALVLSIALTSLSGCDSSPTGDPIHTEAIEPIDLSVDQTNSTGPLLTNGPGPNVIATVICNDVGIGSGIRLEVSPSTSCETQRQYPHLHLGLFDRNFREQPEGYWYWPEYEVYDEDGWMISRVNGYYCATQDECESANVAVYVEQWEGERYGANGWSPDPEILIGQPVSGWYVIELSDGTQLGNAFNGTWCGQNWDYCD